MLNRLSIHLPTLVLIGVIVISWLVPVSGTAQTGTVNTCDRHPVVDLVIRESIFRLTSTAHDCDAVPEADLALIVNINLGGVGAIIGNSGQLTSGDFSGLSSLEVLLLNGTGISTLPPDIFDGLSSLEVLDLGYNRLTTLPAGVFHGLSSLRRLNLGNFFDLGFGQNRLTTLPAGVFDGLSSLELLDLSRIGLTTLPAGVFDGLSSLVVLDLSDNDFTTLPVGVFDDVLDTLGTSFGSFIVDDSVRQAHFVCSRADADFIVSVTDGVNDCLRITSAQLDAALQTSFVNICERTRLVEERILAAINPTPPCWAVPETELAAITSLILSNLRISPASGDFTGLSSLEVLDLGNTALTTLPADVFDGLSSLKGLSLSRNDFTTLPAGVFDGLSALEELFLYSNNLNTLPAGVFDSLSSLEALWLYSNDLNTLPDGVFDSLSSLVVLGLDDNALTTLPDGVFDSLSALERLYLGENALTTLPAGVFDNLSSLVRLDLGSNRLFTFRLPAGVFDNLSALERLNLSDNFLITLPAGVFDGLSALEWLDLGGNALTTLPAGVFDGLSVLETLSLRLNDDLITLPAGVFDDVLDTLGPIGSSFFVDDYVRRAHFVCSRADADAIVAATAGVDDCLRITSAQLNIALQDAVTANGQLTDAIDALDISGDGVINPDLLQRISNVLADAGDFGDIVAADLAGEDITVSQAIDFLATLNAALEPAGMAIQAGAAVEMATVTGIIDGIGDVIAALDDTSLSPILINAVQGAAQTTLAAVSDLAADDADPDSTEAILDSASQVVNVVLGVDATLEGDFKAAAQSLAESVLQKSLDDIAVALGRDSAVYTFTDTASTRALLAQNPTLLDRVLEVTAISLTGGTTQLDTAATQSAITDAGISAEGAEALTADLNQFVIPPAFMLEINGQMVSVLDLLSDAPLGFGAATVDSTTGTVVFAADIGAIETFVTAVAIVPDSVPEGVFMTPDGSALSIANGVAITLAPSPAAPIEFAAAIDVIGGGEFTTTILANGILVLSHTPTGVAFNATFAFDISIGEPVAVTSFIAPEGNDPADPEYLFGVTFEEGSTQSIVPMIAAPQFYDSMAAMGFEMETDRSTGVITINGARFRADYFSFPATSAEILFLDSNADASGVAYIPTDANGDGIMDSKVITRINDVATMQFLYRLP